MRAGPLPAFLAEPRPPLPATPPRWDRWLVAVLLPAVVLEALLREGVVWRPVAVGLGVVMVGALLFRRDRPLLAFGAAFGAAHAVGAAAFLAGVHWVELYGFVVALLLVYSVFRWGSGREVAAGVGLLALGYAASMLAGAHRVDEVVGAAVVPALPAVLGLSLRFRAKAQLRELDQVKLRERELLARELHDTVAHHVSAIAIQAQAGRAVAASRPEAAVEALKTIETAAKRTLTEMRSIVSALRAGDPELAPQPGVADIERLAQGAANGCPVDVTLSGDLGDLRPSLEATLYRLAQESLTNAVRHARNASRITIAVEADATADVVRLTVSDDGEGAPSAGRRGGFGLAGMAERVALLGGTFGAGPKEGRGWRVEASLPRRGGGG